MNLLKITCAVTLLAGMLAGCGQTSVQTVMVPNGGYPNAQGKGMTAVVLPFADYSGGDRIASAFRRHLMTTESLTDNLRRNGFNAPVQEDVFQHLVEQKVISLAAYGENSGGSASLASELEDPDWSDLMKGKIQDYMRMQEQQLGGGKNPAADSPGTHGLSDQEVVKIGRKFGADYIIRGRILEFRTRQDHTWDPRRRGLIPFVIGTTSQAAFGFADAEQYDNLDDIAAGGVWGAAVGSGDGDKTILWSAAGGAAGAMAKHGGKVDQAVVRLRIWVQNAYDAQVVWTNQVEVRVAPESVMADGQYDDLFDQAIKKATNALMNDFVQTGLKP
ncbi:MAG: hypothetical protein ACTFAL_11040 [Candidatus Electronema sp. V4]|uniref:hypothetical protein n=1 Tax=Candidatus Electronema sp. V4 TaxID=3454756 RepID=UPI00405578F9